MSCLSLSILCACVVSQCLPQTWKKDRLDVRDQQYSTSCPDALLSCDNPRTVTWVICEKCFFFFFVSQFVCPQCVSTSVVVAMFCNQRNLEILSNVKMQRNDVSFSFWNVNHSESSNVLFGSDCLEKVLKWWFACCCPFPKLCSFSSTFQRMYKKKKPRRRGEDLQKSMFSCKRKGPAECFEFLFVQLLKLLHKRANKYRVSLEKCVEIYWKKKKMWWKRWYKTKPLDVEIWRPLWTLNISK